MKATLSYKTKNRYLVISAILLLIIAWRAAITPAFLLYRSNQELKTQLEAIQNAPAELTALESKATAFRALITNFSASPEEDNQLFEMVSTRCMQNQVILREIPAGSFFENEQFIMQTNTVMVEGSFVNLVKFIHALETTHQPGRLSSVNFKLYKKNKEDAAKLRLTIWLQNIKLKDHE